VAAETTGRLNVISDVTQMARDVYERHRDVITTMATDRGSMATDDDDMARRFIAYHYASYLHQSANANFIFQRPWLAPIRRISRPIFAGRPAGAFTARCGHAPPRFNIPRRTKPDLSRRSPETVAEIARVARRPVYARNIHWKCYRALRFTIWRSRAYSSL